MADKVLLSILTPDRKIFEEEVEELVLPGGEGYLGVLPGHAPLLTSLKVGELSFKQAQRWQYAFIAWGFAEVLPGKVSVLADVGELADEIDRERANAAHKRARERIEKGGPDIDHARAMAALARAMGRIAVAGRQ